MKTAMSLIICVSTVLIVAFIFLLSSFGKRPLPGQFDGVSKSEGFYFTSNLIKDETNDLKAQRSITNKTGASSTSSVKNSGK